MGCSSGITQQIGQLALKIDKAGSPKSEEKAAKTSDFGLPTPVFRFFYGHNDEKR